jgi:hypothetical protein
MAVMKFRFLYIFLILLLGTAVVHAQDESAKECAELQKTVNQYAAETDKIKLTLSFKTNSSYWRGASEELSFGIARRRIAADLQAIAFKLGVKRLKDWEMVPKAEKLAYQETVSRALEREKERSIMADQTALEARLAEIEKQLKPIRLRVRDLGCADQP